MNSNLAIFSLLLSLVWAWFSAHPITLLVFITELTDIQYTLCLSSKDWQDSCNQSHQYNRHTKHRFPLHSISHLWCSQHQRSSRQGLHQSLDIQNAEPEFTNATTRALSFSESIFLRWLILLRSSLIVGANTRLTCATIENPNTIAPSWTRVSRPTLQTATFAHFILEWMNRNNHPKATRIARIRANSSATHKLLE
jgi:hypothetical protein